MTDCSRQIALPIPCPRCDHILSHRECDCGFILGREIAPVPEPEEPPYDGQPLFI